MSSEVINGKPGDGKTYQALSIAEKIKVADRLLCSKTRPRSCVHQNAEIRLCREFDRHTSEIERIERDFDRLVFDGIRKFYTESQIREALK